MRVWITASAEADLEDIGNFIALDSPLRADSFVLELIERCHGLAEQPQHYPVATIWRAREMRRCPHGNYLIFYTLIGDRLEIDRIVHGARDYLRVLFPDD